MGVDKPQNKKIPNVGTLYALSLEERGWAVLVIAAVAKGRKGPFQGRAHKDVWKEIPSGDQIDPAGFCNEKLTFTHGPLGIWNGDWIEIGTIPESVAASFAAYEQYSIYEDKVYTIGKESLQGVTIRAATSDLDRALPIYSASGHVYISAWLKRNL